MNKFILWYIAKTSVIVLNGWKGLRIIIRPKGWIDHEKGPGRKKDTVVLAKDTPYMSVSCLLLILYVMTCRVANKIFLFKFQISMKWDGMVSTSKNGWILFFAEHTCFKYDPVNFDISIRGISKLTRLHFKEMCLSFKKLKSMYKRVTNDYIITIFTQVG